MSGECRRICKVCHLILSRTCEQGAMAELIDKILKQEVI